jgi:hypothetical protein
MFTVSQNYQGSFALVAQFFHDVSLRAFNAKQSPVARGDCFGGSTPPRNDTRFGFN